MTDENNVGAKRLDGAAIACRLRLNPSAESSYLGDVEIENGSPESIEIMTQASKWEHLNFITWDDNGRLVSKYHYGSCLSPHFQSIVWNWLPGEKLIMRRVSLMATVPTAARKPGKYRTQAVYTYETLRAESEVVAFEYGPGESRDGWQTSGGHGGTIRFLEDGSVNPESVLTPEDYANYRNVREAATLFTVLGGILAFGGVGAALHKNPTPDQDIPVAAAVGLALVGLAGVGGGLAALTGSRRWAWLAYLAAALYVFGLPLGTFLSIVLFAGLSRYLNSMDRLRAVRDGDRRGIGPHASTEAQS